MDAERDDERYSDNFYLAAEVVSSSDRNYVESKREVYELHDTCKSILTIQQDRVEVRIELRTEAGWGEQVLNRLISMIGWCYPTLDLAAKCPIYTAGPRSRRARPTLDN